MVVIALNRIVKILYSVVSCISEIPHNVSAESSSYNFKKFLTLFLQEVDNIKLFITQLL